MTSTANTSDEAADPIWGVEAIAEVVKRTPRVTFHLLSTGAIPGRKVGGRWMVDRAVLNRFLRGEAA